MSSLRLSIESVLRAHAKVGGVDTKNCVLEMRRKRVMYTGSKWIRTLAGVGACAVL